ncbi:PaaI family thioesterase [Malikia sp.]|uniref:PaaI family thioesterase n=1 Tax=Malikia sp. TaxID=2070706 RepID=UPI00262CCDA2|nr:PaaI family thioesterase [Malikia sp.]MDD2728020.1 PaaI family thioesterase [Malikia sp.]
MEFPVHIPFVELLGLELLRWENDEAEVRFDSQSDHHNSFSVVHGGALMTLLDVAMAHAARSGMPELGAVTIEMKTSFMQAARGPLLAKARVLHRSATMAFTEGSVLDADGKLCCHATGTFKCIRRLPVGAKDAQALNGAGPVKTD